MQISARRTKMIFTCDNKNAIDIRFTYPGPTSSENWAHRNLYRVWFRGCVAKGRSKRKRRKSHSVQRRAIDRGDEARSAICTRDALRRISRMDEDVGARTHARTQAQTYMRVTHRRLACADRFRSPIYGGRKKIPQKKRYREIIRTSLETGSLFTWYYASSAPRARSLWAEIYTAALCRYLG